MNNKIVKKIGHLIEENFYPIIISIIVFSIALANFKPGTFLSGWDTLHPEFNLSLNIKRAISGVWNANEGLGALEGHSIMADLPRILILWALHFLFPLNTLRYIYVFICLLTGPLGIYYLINYLFTTRHIVSAKIIALVAALYYLFNLSTVQQFYVPFEMFTTQYAFLPWIILFSIVYLKKPSKKNAFLFILVTLISTPQAYAAHLWYAFFGTYLVFLMLFFLLYERNKNGIKKITSLILLTIVINAFWLLPNLYFIKTANSVPQESKQNRIYSQEYRLKNREYGYLKDVALVKGFYFSWLIFDFSKDRYTYLMQEWNYVNTPLVKNIGYILFFLTIIGIIFSFIKKDRLFIIIFPFFLIPFVFLMNHTPPFEQFFNYLSHFSLFQEGLRFVFTKFSIILIFSYVIYASYALSVIYCYLKRQWIAATISLLLILGLFIFTYPITQGNLISDKMKVSIPQEYFDFYKFMDKQPKGLVLTLPMHSFSGWQYYKWGYQGSGFIWFGLKQPVLDRDFDRWSEANEKAYREISHALYSKDSESFIRNLSKYNVKYIMWDKSNIPRDQKNRNQLAFAREIKVLLDQLQKNRRLTLLKTFNNILVYENKGSLKEFITIQKLPEVQPIYKWSYSDLAYYQIGDYITHLSNTQNIKNKYVFPYRDLITYNDQIRPNFFYKLRSVQDKNNIHHLKAEAILQKNINAKGVKLFPTTNENVLDFISKNKQVGVSLDLLDILHDHNTGYILVFVSRNIEGLPLRFCFHNMFSKRCDLYDELTKNTDFNYDYFFVAPAESGGLGYQLYIDNISYGNYLSHNQLKELFVIPVSTDILKQYNRQGYTTTPQILLSINDKNIKNYGSFMYAADISDLSTEELNSYITFNQSYNSGWKAYQIECQNNNLKCQISTFFPFIFGQELKNHVLVNNWANGWEIESETCNAKHKTCQINIIFWPQYLEFLGFGLLFITFLFILFPRQKNEAKDIS